MYDVDAVKHGLSVKSRHDLLRKSCQENWNVRCEARARSLVIGGAVTQERSWMQWLTGG